MTSFMVTRKRAGFSVQAVISFSMSGVVSERGGVTERTDGGAQSAAAKMEEDGEGLPKDGGEV